MHVLDFLEKTENEKKKNSKNILNTFKINVSILEI